MRYFRDYIKAEYKNWEKGDIVCIEAPPGFGKTTFLLDNFLLWVIEQGKRILYLNNRAALEGQVLAILAEAHDIKYENLAELASIRHFQGISVFSYQALQEYSSFSLDDYDYIFFDEAHYFLSDSGFNPKIGKLWKQISHFLDCCCIFCSATLEEVKELLSPFADHEIPINSSIDSQFRAVISIKTGRKIKNYSIPADYSFLQCYYYKEIEDIIKKIKGDDTDKKWLIFINNKETVGKQFEKAFPEEEIDIITAADRDSDAMKSIVKTGTLRKKIVVSTKVLDNGMSITDELLKNIVLSTSDRIDAIQMIGRKRRAFSEEGVALYIPIKSAKEFQGSIRYQIQPGIEDIEMFKKDRKEYIRNLQMNKSVQSRFFNYFYLDNHERIQLNALAEQYLNNQKKAYEKIIQRFKEEGEYAFVNEVLSWLKRKESFSPERDLRGEKIRNVMECLKDFLYQNADIPIQDKGEFKEEYEKLVRKIPHLKIRKDCEFSKMTINRQLQRLQIAYKIGEIRKGNFRQWVIRRDEG